MTRTATVVASGGIGAALGALSGRILFGGSAWNLIPWAGIALAIGIIADGRRAALLASGIYGYLLSAVFLFVADTSSNPVAQRILYASVLGLAGPVCSIVLTLIAHTIRVRAIRRRPSPR